MATHHILIERDEVGYIASDNISVVYGCGETIEEALGDYVRSFVEYLQLLTRPAHLRRREDNHERLG